VPERIAVIGSNSFSGSSFVDHVLRNGGEVIGFSRSPEPAEPFLPYRWDGEERSERFEFVRADLNHDLDLMIERIGDFRPSIVVNFAAQSMVAESWAHPEDWYRTNVIANVLLHDRLRVIDHIRRYVHVSTP
jgi:dTDP-glucose 4,6-dehydratase